MSEIKNHQFFLNLTLEIAHDAVAKGNHPFGAVLVVDGELKLRSENSVHTDGDVTSHAEFLLVQKAQKILSASELARSILYTSTEPCAMCCGALYWVGVRKVSYGCSSERLAQITGGGLRARSQMIFALAKEKVTIEECLEPKPFEEIHLNYWS